MHVMHVHVRKEATLQLVAPAYCGSADTRVSKMSRQLDSASDGASSIGSSDAGSESGRSDAGSQVADDGGDLLKESKFSLKVPQRSFMLEQHSCADSNRMCDSEPG